MEQKKSNKKLVIIITIAVVVIVAIVGVVVFMSSKGGNGAGTKDVAKMSKEAMLEIAEDISKREEKKTPQTNSYFIDLSKNMANAEIQKGRIFLMEDKIANIEKDYCEYSYGTIKVRLYIDTATLALLKTDNYIKVVGQLTDIIKEPKMVAGMSYEDTIFEFKNCHFIKITK